MRNLWFTLVMLLLGVAPLVGQQRQHALPDTAAEQRHPETGPSRWHRAVTGAKIGAIAGGVITGGFFVYEYYIRDQCPASTECQKSSGGWDLRPVGLVATAAVGAVGGTLIGGLVGIAVPGPGRIGLVAAFTHP